MGKKIVAIIMLLCLLTASGLSVEALRAVPPSSFERLSEDGTIILRYYASDAEYNRHSLTVYRNDSSRQVIYTIDEFSLWWLGSLFNSDDMMHLIHHKYYYGFVFYAYGEEVGRVERREFIYDYASHEGSMAQLWTVNWRMINLDSDTLQFTIETDEGRTVVFDMTNGNILYDEVRTNNVNSLALYGTIATAIALVTIAVIIKAKANEVK